MRQITSSLQIERGLSGEEERGGKEDIKAPREGGKGFGGEFIRSLKSRDICPFFLFAFFDRLPPPPLLRTLTRTRVSGQNPRLFG